MSLTRSMSSVWIPGDRIKHLFRISVIGSDTQHISCLFTGIIDSLDGLVGRADGDYCGVVNSSMTNLAESVGSVTGVIREVRMNDD
jgi:hypothetical protein